MVVPVNSAQVRVGRLLEIRAEAGYRAALDVDVLFEVIVRETAVLAPGTRHVTIVDWRNCPIMSPEAAERMGFHLRGRNTHTERSAALARADAPLQVLQFLRVIRDAGLPDRKLFFSENEAADWLSEVLTPAESRQLRQFLSEASPTPPTWSVEPGSSATRKPRP